ncbi:phage repressor protein C with HTH and peptisase S24 domain [Novosphingobium sediminicola]|uniref:Phage repressor protein C with HTH and peptisase S24 domain n=2 Tax=Novosphingobium sediminicola TaxID=563162 RepID=A0A7W6CI16_9SPHN|nr:phage repressor protein C with HTH and peptisase S24 domain [Novosphingobium sediminicola]
MSDTKDLRGMALYEALMKLKPESLSPTNWALQAGVNRGFFSNLKVGNGAVRSDSLRKLLAQIGRTEDELYSVAGGVQPTLVENVRPISIETIAEEQGWALIEEIDLALGMGATFLDANRLPERLGIIPFRMDWLREIYRGPIAGLKIVRGRGDSMEPTIRDGDFVLVDTSRQRLDEQDVVWAVSYGDLGMIRRLRQMPGGGIQLMPDNPVVRPLEAHDGEMHIIGRVIWIGRRM